MLSISGLMYKRKKGSLENLLNQEKFDIISYCE